MSDEAKNVEFYAAQVNAWINTKFEHDKSLLTLSAGGVGLLITVVLATGISSTAALMLYCCALFSFIVSLTSLLWIFRRNAHHLEQAVKGNSKTDPVLSILDTVALTSFLLGVLFSSLIGISSAIDSLGKKEKEMTEQKKQDNSHPTYDSINGLSNLQPQGMQKSINDINNMKPAPQQTQQPAPQNQPASTPKQEGSS